MSITAVIPVRAGSKRLPNKNILPFGNSNLLVHKIQELKKVRLIDNIVVSTDSDKMIEMAIKEGVDYKKRPIEYCDEKTKTFNEVVEYVAANESADILMWTPCVCPMITGNIFENAIDTFLKKQDEFDSLISAQLLKEYIFDENKPVNFSIENHVPSQKLPNWHIITNGFFIAKRENMKKWKFVYGKNPFLYEISKFEAIDIDDYQDYQLALNIFDVSRRNNEQH